jgi:H+/Cl- antiporter ClcA
MNDKSSAPWKVPIMIVGGVIGALVGVVAARMWIRGDALALKKDIQRKPQGLSLSPIALLPIALSVIKLLRQIGSLSDND